MFLHQTALIVNSQKTVCFVEEEEVEHNLSCADCYRFSIINTHQCLDIFTGL
jgi:hypothetical protein